MKNLVSFLLLACALLVSGCLTGCMSVEKTMRTIPGFEFESWSHSDRYGVFTDSVTLAGAKWELAADGSATLTLAQYDGSAAWAGTVGPHDIVSKLVVHFPPTSPQAVMLKAGVTPK